VDRDRDRHRDRGRECECDRERERDPESEREVDREYECDLFLRALRCFRALRLFLRDLRLSRDHDLDRDSERDDDRDVDTLCPLRFPRDFFKTDVRWTTTASSFGGDGDRQTVLKMAGGDGEGGHTAFIESLSAASWSLRCGPRSPC